MSAHGDWNILAGRIVQDGFIEIVETDLPITINSLDSNLSSPSTIQGSIQNQVKRLKVNNRPIFEPWNTVIIAEASDQIRGMGIYRKPTFTGSAWQLDIIGFSGYPIGMPYTSDRQFIDADPMDIYRHVWDHLQTQPGGNLRVTVDDTKSPVTVGISASLTEEAEPRRLAWWETKDLGAVIDGLTKETPFDWREQLYWGEQDQPRCHIGLGYPVIGSRKDHMRLVLGENLAQVPGATEGDYINQAQVLGAGEGRDRVRGYSGVSDARLRRVRTVDNKGITARAQADAMARDELVAARVGYSVSQVEVFDHPNAPLAAIELGDELPLYAEEDWIQLDHYVRVVGKSESPQQSTRATLTVVRATA